MKFLSFIACFFLLFGFSFFSRFLLPSPVQISEAEIAREVIRRQIEHQQSILMKKMRDAEDNEK